jgi:Protein of unknown function (DUF2934)
LNIRIVTLSEENMDKALYNRIAKVAYDLYERKGRRNGCQEEDWLEAEKTVKAQLAKEAATKKGQVPKAEAQKVVAKAEPQKGAARKAAPAETRKKAGKPAAKTSASKKKIFPEATM